MVQDYQEFLEQFTFTHCEVNIQYYRSLTYISPHHSLWWRACNSHRTTTTSTLSWLQSLWILSIGLLRIRHSACTGIMLLISYAEDSISLQCCLWSHLRMVCSSRRASSQDSHFCLVIHVEDNNYTFTNTFVSHLPGEPLFVLLQLRSRSWLFFDPFGPKGSKLDFVQPRSSLQVWPLFVLQEEDEEDSRQIHARHQSRWQEKWRNRFAMDTAMSWILRMRDAALNCCTSFSTSSTFFNTWLWRFRQLCWRTIPVWFGSLFTTHSFSNPNFVHSMSRHQC